MILRLVLLFVLLGCQHVVQQEPGWLRKEWIVNTLSEPYLKTKILQKTKSILTSDLVLQGDSLYGVRAYSRGGGNLQWFFSVTGGVEGGLAVDGERLVFGGSDGFFYCLELKTGILLWKFYTGSENLGEPFVSNDHVYFLTSKEKVYALNIRTGKLIWMHRPQSTSVLSIRGVSRPFADNKRVYVGFSDGTVSALNRKTGQWIWKVSLAKGKERFKDVDASPVVRGNLLYVSSFDGGMFSLNKITGKTVWRNKEGSYFAPSIDGKTLYYASSNSEILALNRFSGKVLWKRKIKGLATRPVVYGAFLLYGLSTGPFHIIDKKDGSLSYKLNMFRGVSAEPVLDVDLKEMYVMSIEAWLYKFSLLF